MARGTVWDDLVGRRQVTDRLAEAVRAGTTSHAYLFVGPPGAGKKTAAKALACALLCDDGGCGTCAACYRVKRGFHPDVHAYRPEGAAGYLVSQVREIAHDVSLRPVEGARKVYIIDAADAFNDAAANAFLKTLEEPPPGTTIVLLAHAYDAVMPTLVSRCQVVRFGRIAPSVAAALLQQRSGATEDDALAALAAAGGVVSRAADFVRSPARREARDLVVRTLKDLRDMDGADVLAAARAMLAAVKAPLEDLKEAHASEIEEHREFVGGSAKRIEERHKRELTAREREGVGEVLSVTESWLRDVLALREGASELVVN
ncbi:MAG: DNA polymerase III subunit delta', partial [Actinobacteria bacterium]